MMTTTHILTLLLCLCLVLPVAAVTYSEEYYTLGKDVNTWMYGGALRDMGYADVTFQLAELREIRRQTILMEKQNKLLEEHNMLLRNLTRTDRGDSIKAFYIDPTVFTNETGTVR